MNKYLQYFSGLLLLIMTFIFGNYFPLVKEHFPVACESQTRTFEYEGCTINYNEIEYNDYCEPCGGVIPCINGFHSYGRINILRCLCNKGDSESAKEFARKYLIGNEVTYKNSNYILNSKNNSNEYITEILNEDEITQLCERVPEQPYYQ